MRCAVAVLSAGIVVFGGAVQAADRLPKDMLGAWASAPAACGEQASELAMTIEPRSVLFYEHGYEIRRVVRRKDGSLKIFGYSVADGERTRDSTTLRLVAADRIEVGQAIYHRCKSGKK